MTQKLLNESYSKGSQTPKILIFRINNGEIKIR